MDPIPGKSIPGGVSVETVFASALREATADSPTYLGGKGALFLIDVSAEDGAITLTPTLQAYDSIAAAWVTITEAAAITAVSHTRFLIYPGVLGDADYDLGLHLPAIWRLSMVSSGSTSMTYSVEGHFYG